MKYTQQNFASLIFRFSRLMVETLEEKTINLVNEENFKRGFDNSCATHDHIDANMVMDEAFYQVMGFYASDDIENEQNLFFWNNAWDAAKRNGFKHF